LLWFLTLVDVNTDEERISNISKTLLRLPDTEKIFLKEVCEYLSYVCSLPEGRTLPEDFWKREWQGPPECKETEKGGGGRGRKEEVGTKKKGRIQD
jgi:hypothetical protein